MRNVSRSPNWNRCPATDLKGLPPQTPDAAATGTGARPDVQLWRSDNIATLAADRTNQLAQLATTPEIGDQLPGLGFLAIATQIVLVHIQIGAQGMQFLNVKMVAKRLPQPHALAGPVSA
jgi:hypothetical protein